MEPYFDGVSPELRTVEQARLVKLFVDGDPWRIDEVHSLLVEGSVSSTPNDFYTEPGAYNMGYLNSRSYDYRWPDEQFDGLYVYRQKVLNADNESRRPD